MSCVVSVQYIELSCVVVSCVQQLDCQVAEKHSAALLMDRSPQIRATAQ